MREYEPISVGGGGEFAMFTEKESSWDDILSRGICFVVNVGSSCICEACRWRYVDFGS